MSAGQENPFPQEREAGSAEHLAFEHLDPVDVSFDDAGVPGKGEADLERDRLKLLNTTLQKTLLPPVLANVPGLDVDAYYHIASVDEVGGDFYDLFPLADGTWGLFLGDVCGKGAAAAAVTAASGSLWPAAATPQRC